MQGKLLGHMKKSSKMMQLVGRLVMGNPMLICHQEDAAHNALQINLQRGGSVVQPIALLHQVKRKMREDTLVTREGGHQPLHLLHRIHPHRLFHQEPNQRKEAIGARIQHGSGHAIWKSSKKGEKMLLSSLMMVPMVPRIKFLDLSNNLILHLVESILKNAPNCGMLPCTSKSLHVNGGLVCVRAA